MKRFFKKATAHLSLAVLATVIFSHVPPASADDTSMNVSSRITGASVMYQSFLRVGDTAPNEVEDQALWTIVAEMQRNGVEGQIAALEQFLVTFPNSAWTPSLRANLGRHYFEHGLSSKALPQWEAAWAATRLANEGPAKKVADFTFAYWTRLLAGLGRAEELKKLFEETQGRIFDGPLQQVINGSREGYNMMRAQPGTSFKCGTFALNTLARSLSISPSSLVEITQTPSPTNGFNMTRLMDLANKAGMNVTAVRWNSQKSLVVPSVVHWRQKHYATIQEQKQNLYLVLDPTFGKPRWLTADEIREEASGHFIIPKDKMSDQWQTLTKAETDGIFGQGQIWGADDFNDGCGNGAGGSGGGNQGSAGNAQKGNSDGGTKSGNRCPSCGGSGGTSTGGDGAPHCCPGMAKWDVSEPYINLFIYDEPIGYSAAFGERISFELSYKQRESRQVSSNFFNFGPFWNCFWLDYISDDSAGVAATMTVAGGGERSYTPDNQTREFFSRTILNRQETASNLTAFVLTHADGSTNYYGFVPVNNINAHKVAFLTEKVDASGHTNRFIYDETNNVVRLRYVLDAEGKTNRLTYTNLNFPAQVTGVEDRFGRKAFLQYDQNGYLTNIIDPVQIKSSFKYGENGWITNLTTPYGVTAFQHYTNSSSHGDEFQVPPENFLYYMIRAVKVRDAAGGTNIYMLRQDSSYVYLTNISEYHEVVQQDYPAAIKPQGVPTHTLGTNDSMQFRNSFHWDPRQANALPVNLEDFDKQHFLKARMRHWLHQPNGTADLSHILSIEQAPSPDGVQLGQTTWYDYYGKEASFGGATWECGTNSMPSLVAQVIGDGTTAYTWYRRDQWGRATNVVETYSLGYGETPLTRTNVSIYSGPDLVAEIGTDGTVRNGYAYNANHSLIRHTNAVGDISLFNNNDRQQLTNIVSAAGLTTANYYFTSGSFINWLEKSVDIEINRTNSFTYVDGLVFTHTNERGTRFTNTWDGLQRLLRVDYPDGTSVVNTYSNLDLTQTVDRMGFTNSLGYDQVRRLTASTNALGHYTLFNYCPCSALESVRDAENNFTTYFYDEAGHLVKTLYADAYTVTNNFNLFGQITNVIDSAGRSTTNWFNNQGMLYAVSNAFGRVSTLAFDIEDRVTDSVNVNGVLTSMTYDGLGRVLARTYPDTGVERFGYSPRGLINYTNQLGSNVTRYVYDEGGRKIAETNANLEVTQFRYDASGNLTNLNDGKQQDTWWNYDGYGRVTNKIDHLNNPLFVYKYDADDRLTNRWSAAKGTTVYRYDPGHNLTNVDYAASHDLYLKYDALHRLTNMVDDIGTTAYAYDGAGQLLSEDGPWAQDTVSYSYNNRERAALRLLQANASAWEVSYAYDAARRLTNITSPAGAFGHAYDPEFHAEIRKLSLPSGAFITNAFDSVGRLRTTYLKSSAGAFLNVHKFFYDVAGQQKSLTHNDGSTLSYGYDAIGQLTSARGTNTQSRSDFRKHEQLSHRYDKAGNLNYRTNNGFVQTFLVNGLNELTNVYRDTTNFTVAGTTTSQTTNVTVNGLAATLYDDYTFAREGFGLPDGSNTFTAVAADALGRSSTDSITVNLPTNSIYLYDLNGNLLSDGRRGFEFDDENQLTRVTVTNAWKSEFSYDGKMRRRIRKEYGWNGSAWQLTNEIHYVYDRNLVIQERDTNNLGLVTYTRGRDLSGSLDGAGGIGGLLARSDMRSATGPNPPAGSHAYYHGDANGNVTCLVDSNQIVVARYLYDPFGNTLSASGPLADANLYRFSSKECHFESGLYYYGFRYYEPNLQRWLNRDPIEEQGGIDLYAYGGNSPINRLDPLGLAWYDGIAALAGLGSPGSFSEAWGGFGESWSDSSQSIWKAIKADNWNELADAYEGGVLDQTKDADPVTKYGTRGCLVVATAAVSAAVVLDAAGISSRIAAHGSHHSFGPLGRLPHVQLNWWRAGVKGSGGAFRIPVPPGTPGFPP